MTPLPRLQVLDVLRGVSLLGIAALNAPDLIGLSGADLGQDGLNRSVYYWSELLLRGHFFPIFSLLFGVSFALVIDGARRRGQHAVPVFLRRLSVLAALGLLHHQVQPGEVLLPYAFFGLLLLPFEALPSAVGLGASALLALLGFWTTPILLTPAMFLLGLTLARKGAFQRHAAVRPVLLRSFPLLATLAVVMTVVNARWQAAGEPSIAVVNGQGLDLGTVAGLVGAGAVTSGVWLLVMQWIILPGVLRPLARLGQMSLSTYLLQTLVFVVLGLAGWHGGARALTVPACIMVWAVTLFFSTWWLSRFSMGPMEFVMRWGTTLRRPDLHTRH